MPQPRQRQVSLDATPYYHLVSRCVRRAFLCGLDRFTGRCFDHRKQWLEDRFVELANIFAVDLCAYAVMSNHYHIVVHVDRERGQGWTNKEVVKRWHKLFNGNLLSTRFLAGDDLSKAEEQMLQRDINCWRERLFDLGWFMRCINEPIARESNKEDDCTGRFWEGRYKSQALLDEKALLACMAYVDLNPVRAGTAKTPETSDYTSIKKRVAFASNNPSPTVIENQPKELFPFVGNPRKNIPTGLSFSLIDYMNLIDATGRVARNDKGGSIALDQQPILDRLGLNQDEWTNVVLKFEEKPTALVGSQNVVKACLDYFCRKRLYGVKLFN